MAQVKKSEVRAAIVEGAYRLFRSQGYLGTSMADIGRAANVAPSNIYVYFESKFEIFYAVYEPWLNRRLERLKRELRRIDDPNGRVRHILETAWLRLPSEDNGFANNLMQAVSAGGDERFRSDLLSRCEAVLSDLLAGSLPAERADIVASGRLAHIILMAFDGFVVRYHLGATRKDMQDIIGLMADLIVRPAGAGEAAPAAPLAAPLPQRTKRSLVLDK